MRAIGMQQFFLGTIVGICIAISLIFLKFWRKAGDRLFLYFALSFLLLGINWAGLALAHRDEPKTILYLVRLFAFSVLLLGIWDKNRAHTRQKN
jgi:hypothetical protein